jgi:glycosyltransferase involved in cell wall biosynthesis
MRIAIDGRTIKSTATGVGQYAENLVRSLLKIDHENHYVLFLIEPNDEIEAQNLTKILVTGYERMVLNRWWENLILPQYIQAHHIDLYFSPAYALPYLPRFAPLGAVMPGKRIRQLLNIQPKARYVVTIHDLISYIHPEFFTPKMRMWQKFFVPNALKVADMIIADSETTKQDITRLFDTDPTRIEVIWPWFDTKYQQVADENLLREVRSAYGLPDKFILCLGTVEPRKNIAGLARAYSMLPAHLQKEYRLVLGGALGWYADSIMNEVRSINTHGSIIHLDYVEHRHMPALYTLASCLAFPSFYEGFGLPLVEAMACGAPILTSNISAIPDVVGDAALLVDPWDTTGIARALEQILTDRRLQDTLRARGFERMKLFDWRRNTERTLSVFNATMEKG